jgi:FKBP-type peptidyl-prolyl cis-trans isomerase FkpA
MTKSSFTGISFLLCALSVSAVFAAAQLPQKPATVTGEGKKTESGVRYWDIKVGTGAEAQKDKLVSVHYTCWLPDGKVIDSSIGHNPVSFEIFGLGEVIGGWSEGVAGMKTGGKRQLRIPPDMAYGSSGIADVVPPDAELTCDLQLLHVGVQDALPPEAQEAFDRGLAAVEQKDWELAVKYFSQAQEPWTEPQPYWHWDRQQPGNTYPNLLLNLGLAHGKAGHELAAIAWLQAYLAAAPKAANADAVRKEIARLDVAAESKIAAVIRLAYDTAGKVQSDPRRLYLLGQVADAQAYAGDVQSAGSVKMANDPRRMAMLWSFYALGLAESNDFEGATKAADTARNYADNDGLRFKDVDLMSCLDNHDPLTFTPLPSMRMSLSLLAGLDQMFFSSDASIVSKLPGKTSDSPLTGDLLADAIWDEALYFYVSIDRLEDAELAGKAFQQLRTKFFVPKGFHPMEGKPESLLRRVLDYAQQLSNTDEVVRFDVTLKTAGVNNHGTPLEASAIGQTGISWALTKRLYYLRAFNRELATQTTTAKRAAAETGPLTAALH